MGTTACWTVGFMEQQSAEIARRLRSGDPDVVEFLMEQYQFRLFRYLLFLTGNREAAEDLFQETWVRVLERGSQYNGRWRFESWLFSISRHLFIDRLRQKKPVSLEALTDAEPGNFEVEATDTPSPFDLLSASQENLRVAEALKRLPAVYREVLALRFQEELSLEEIAAVVGAPASTVKSRLYRGLEALRPMLEGDRT